MSKAELRLEGFLRKRGMPYRPQQEISTEGRRFTVDFVVGERCVVECEGAVHAGQVAADNEREALLRKAGYEVLRIPDFVIFGNISEALGKIESCLRAQQGTQDQVKERRLHLSDV